MLNFKNFKLDFSTKGILKISYIAVTFLFLLIVFFYGRESLFGLNDLIYEKETVNLTSTNSQSIPIEDLSEITIDWNHGDIEISSIAGAEVTVTELTAEDISESDKMYVQDLYGTLDIKWTETADRTSVQREKKLIVGIPVGTEIEDVVINNSSGEIYCTGVVGINVVAKTQIGDIRLDGLSAEKISADVSEGNIQISSLQAQESSFKVVTGEISGTALTLETVYARTGEGELSMSGNFVSASISSINSNVSVTNTGVISDLNVYSIYGDVDLKVADSDGFFFKEDSTFGEFTVEGFEFEDSEDGTFYKSDKMESTIKVSSTDGDISFSKIV